MLNNKNDESYVYETGDYSKIILTIKSSINVENALVGLRIKTTTGVEVYGTSTFYHNLNVEFKESNEYLISFEQNLNLVQGTYHVSVAIAKEEGKNDMVYFDKLSDFMLFKVEEIPISGTGIANLSSTIKISN